MFHPGLLKTEQIKLDANAVSKKKALEMVAELLAAASHRPIEDLIYDKLLEREKIGSSGISGGIAIPHVRLDMIHRPHGALIRLKKAITFDSLDEQAVDIIFALAVPSKEDELHLQLLAQLANYFKQANLVKSIRQAKTPQQIYDLFYATSSD